MKPERCGFYFSFWSPYSWIASRLLEARTGDVACDIEYVPYWPPDAETLRRLRSLGGEFLYVQMSRQKHLYILQDVKRILTNLRIAYTWPIDERPWWDLPHLAFLAARRFGREREFFRAVHRARWQEGRDVCREGVLRAIAEEVGVDAEAIGTCAADDSVREEGARALLRAHRDGVFGVPFFIHGRQKFWGVDRLDVFLATVQGHAADGPQPSASAGGRDLSPRALALATSLDDDCAGGCG